MLILLHDVLHSPRHTAALTFHRRIHHRCWSSECWRCSWVYCARWRSTGALPDRQTAVQTVFTWFGGTMRSHDQVCNSLESNSSTSNTNNTISNTSKTSNRTLKTFLKSSSNSLRCIIILDNSISSCHSCHKLLLKLLKSLIQLLNQL